jgi:hypothetical protein
MRLLLHMLGLLAVATSRSMTINSFEGDNRWKFLTAYPKHLLVQRLQKDEPRLAIDGKLDDPAWAGADWHDDSFVDIAHHAGHSQLDAVPSYQQASVAALWDANFLYIGARLKEPVVFGVVPPGHNGKQVPYTDNDFEVFVDPSMSTQFYKEYEMNAVGATYDVNWGVPDQDGLACDSNPNRTSPYLPTCVNTSSPFYAGNWTMAGSSGGAGLKSATHTYSALGSINASGAWTLEIAFPIRKGGGQQDGNTTHGGLLDTDASLGFGKAYGRFFDFDRFDPNNGDAGLGLPRYWAADFARTVHPRKFFGPPASTAHPAAQQPFYWCPFFNCSEEIISNAVNATLQKPGAADCAALAADNPTLLGSNPSYGCYWEWVLQNLGTQQYMHRPLHWPTLQFVQSEDVPASRAHETKKACGNIEFPARHLLLAIHTAQSAFKAVSGGKYYAGNMSALLDNSSLCQPPTCAGPDLKYALAHDHIFSFGFFVEQNASVLNDRCSARPCFTATVNVTVPNKAQYSMVATIDQNKLLRVQHEPVAGGEQEAPCLF